MLKTYFKTAFRNLTRNKSFAIINIMGLAVAMAACLVIFLVLKHEYSYDGYHKNAANIYQIVKNDITADGDEFNTGVPMPATKAFKTEYPQITFGELFASNGSQMTVMTDQSKASNKKFIELTGVFYAEPSLFSIFDVNWLSGSKEVLADENTIVLSKEIATKYFGSWETAVGKYISVDNTVTARVNGIIDDVPANSDFPFKVIISFRSFSANEKGLGFDGIADDWHSSMSNHQVYALLPPAVNPATIDKSLNSFVAKYYKDNTNKNNKKVHFLQPLRNVHFDTRFTNNGTHVSSRQTLYTLGSIGILILLMACINFINLSTAMAVKRNKEVGIRKVLGSSGSQLTAQVMTETLLIVLLSTVIALVLASYSLPYLKYIVQVENTLSLSGTGTILFIVSTIITVTLLSGAYPAVVLGRFKPVEAMKNKINTTQLGGVSLRRLLVVLQFSFSQVLIIATIIVLHQMQFIEKADLGFNKDAVLMLRGNNDSASLAKQDAFKAALLKLPEVRSVSFSNDAPSSGNSWTANFSFDNVATDKDFNATLKFGDADFLKTYGMHLTAGDFYSNDTLRQVVVNETMVRRLGIKDDHKIIGKTIRVGSGSWKTIVGVVKDFKNNSLKEAVPPTIIYKQKKYYGLTAIKLTGTNLGKSNAAIQAVWDSYFPAYAYNSSFFDESINTFYEQEQRMSTLYKIYAGLAIFISCLGLYGLVSFMAVQKTKEVGIRKVLGASISNIVYLFSKEFTILIGIAFLISAPVGYFMMKNWLQAFVYREDISVSVFIIAIITSLVLAWITVGYKAIKAALANPVKSLRTE